MKSRSFLMIAILAPGLLCFAQDQQPATPAAGTESPAQPTTTPVKPMATADNTYVIGANDNLKITVWKEESLSGEILVRPDGMISVPLVGDVQASGLTPLELADQIAIKLKKFVQDPVVAVVVTGIHSKLIYILGEGGKQGPIEMTPDMTVLQAIGSAGGLGQFANKKKIYILRIVNGATQKIPVHYKEALAGNRAFDLPLKAGDTIVIP